MQSKTKFNLGLVISFSFGAWFGSTVIADKHSLTTCAFSLESKNSSVSSILYAVQGSIKIGKERELCLWTLQWTTNQLRIQNYK